MLWQVLACEPISDISRALLPLEFQPPPEEPPEEDSSSEDDEAPLPLQGGAVSSASLTDAAPASSSQVSVLEPSEKLHAGNWP